MNTPAHRTAIRFGILFHGNKIWISELVGMAGATTVLLSLFAVTFLILANESIIHRYDKRIRELHAQQWTTDNMLARLASQQRIGAAIKKATGAAIAGPVYYQLVDLVYNNSKTFGYDPLLVLAVIQVESVFKPDARGRFKNLKLSGALGLMQVKPETAREIAANLGITIKTDADLFKPDINLAIGVAYLTKLISAFKSFKLGLLAYNQGPGVIRESLQANSPLSIDYYQRVLNKYYLLKKSVEQN
jgi:soluble lytic murein transglycosylase-like protein